jgi:hypothetical protein
MRNKEYLATLARVHWEAIGEAADERRFAVSTLPMSF